MTFALKYQPTDRFDALLTYDWVDQGGDIPPQDPRWNGDDPFVNEADYDELQELDVDMLGLTMNFQLGGATLESITGYIAHAQESPDCDVILTRSRKVSRTPSRCAR